MWQGKLEFLELFFINFRRIEYGNQRILYEYEKEKKHVFMSKQN